MQNNMARAKINMVDISRRVAKSGAWKKKARIEMRKLFSMEKLKLLTLFNQHPISEEIQAGPDAQNVSKTLSEGNLYSFMGFQQGSDPVKVVTAFLAAAIRLNKTVKTKALSKKKIRVTGTVKLPSPQALAAVSSMPWEPGKSWVVSVETGISGFSHYMDKVSKASRSGRGIQVKGKIRSAHFNPIPYLSPLMLRFIKIMRRGR
jgi:hypothetical protein